MSMGTRIRETFERNEGILRLAPVFVPRRFSSAGRRLKLHPDDYYALGTARGSIKERWFSSVIQAMNGPLAPKDEGMSYVDPTGNKEDRFLFHDAVAELGSTIIGEELQQRFGTWPMYSKFFDYHAPLFHHLHLKEADANRVGRKGKPEAYYYPPCERSVKGMGAFFCSPATPQRSSSPCSPRARPPSSVTAGRSTTASEAGEGWRPPWACASPSSPSSPSPPS